VSGLGAAATRAPAERRATLADGLTLPYLDAGPAAAEPVIVLLHAWLESRHAFDRLLAALPGSLRAIAPDLRGHGDAAAPTAGYALADVAADVVAFLDAISVRSAVLVGASSGGYVAQQVAIDHPARVAGLVLAGCPRSLRFRPRFADDVEQSADPLDPAWVRRFVAAFRLARSVPSWYVEDRVADALRIPARVWRASLAGLTGAVPPTEAGAIRARTLVAWGAEDDIIPSGEQERLVAVIPGARLLVYEGTGHLVLWEEPARLAADIDAFVAGLSGGEREGPRTGS
jgi:pimeloyl-ACP methyl ester carboxylesterase